MLMKISHIRYIFTCFEYSVSFFSPSFFWMFNRVPHLDFTKVECANDGTLICFLDFVRGAQFL